MFEDKLAKSQIIMISHSAGTIKQYCDCGLLLEGNQIRYFDDVDDLLTAYKEINQR